MMTTIQRQIQQEIKTLPEYAQKQVFNFVLSLKEQKQKTQAEQFSNNKNQAIEEREDWIKTLPEIRLSPKEQQELADSRKTERTEMTIEEFQTYLKHANV